MKYLFFIFIFSSCSLFQKKYKAKNLAELAKLVSLNSGGEASMSFERKKIQFSYETMVNKVNKSDRSYYIEIEIPFQPTHVVDVFKKNKHYKIISPFLNSKKFEGSLEVKKGIKEFFLFISKSKFFFKDLNSLESRKLNTFFEDNCGNSKVLSCVFQKSSVKYEFLYDQIVISTNKRGYSFKWSLMKPIKNKNSCFSNEVYQIFKNNKKLIEGSFDNKRCHF